MQVSSSSASSLHRTTAFVNPNQMFSRQIFKSAHLTISHRNNAVARSSLKRYTQQFQKEAVSLFSTTSTSMPSTSSKNTPQFKNKAYLGIGSNLGNRHDHMITALSLLQNSTTTHTSITRTSHLHETKPMYVLEQPSFLNGVVEISTSLSPMELLNTLKQIEETCGRELKGGVRYGPRVIDLDILLYYSEQKEVSVKEHNLTIPHPLMTEREFVLSPLCDVHPLLKHPTTNATILDTLKALYESGVKMEAVRVLPLPRNRLLAFNQTLIMGILNVTPDSFSDGGQYYSKEEGNIKKAVEEALYMVNECDVDVIDVGGESTRPGSKEVAVEEEMKRVLPVIEEIRCVSDVPISIDTRHSAVAKAAIKAGADIINDVSGGTFDPQMLPTASSLSVPIILMHSRGTPETMSKLTNYSNVVEDVASELWDRVHDAENHGIYKWNIMLDAGIGFAKGYEENVSLLKHGNGKLRDLLQDASMLWGPSRKRFIGTIVEEEDAKERDFGTIGACLAVICGGGNTNDEMDGTKEWRRGVGCHMLRVHNVKAVKQAVMVMDAIHKAD